DPVLLEASEEILQHRTEVGAEQEVKTEGRGRGRRPQGGHALAEPVARSPGGVGPGDLAEPEAREEGPDLGAGAKEAERGIAGPRAGEGRGPRPRPRPAL